jgi:N-acetylneuraminic acid mutarotase
VIFGGINDYDNTLDAFEFDSTKYSWTKLKQTGTVPKPRDDHSLSQINDNSFLIFGGFVQGSRVNECYTCKKNGNTLEWTLVEIKSKEIPCIRASHSTAVYNGKCYIFGGQDDDNNKLNDLWELTLETGMYRLVTMPEGSVEPLARSGHSSNIFNGQMYIFGGILELTKELNEMLIYDFKTGKFTAIGADSAIDDLQNGASMARKNEDGMDSPGLKYKK